MTNRLSQTCKVAGLQTYCNIKTGEIVEMNVYSKTSSDRNFQKVWLKPLLDILTNSSDKKLRVLAYLIRSKNAENIVISSQREIAERCNITVPTVSKSIANLKTMNYIKIVKDSVYQLSPCLLFQGSSHLREKVISDYKSA